MRSLDASLTLKRFNSTAAVDKLAPLHTKFGWFIINRDCHPSNVTTEIVNHAFDEHRMTIDMPRDKIQRFLDEWVEDNTHILKSQIRVKKDAKPGVMYERQLRESVSMGDVGPLRDLKDWYVAKRMVDKPANVTPTNHRATIDAEWKNFDQDAIMKMKQEMKKSFEDGYVIYSGKLFHHEEIYGDRFMIHIREDDLIRITGKIGTPEKRYYFKQIKLGELQKSMDNPHLEMKDVERVLQDGWQQASRADKARCGENFMKLISEGKYLEHGKVIPLKERSADRHLNALAYSECDVELDEKGNVIAVYMIKASERFRWFSYYRCAGIRNSKDRHKLFLNTPPEEMNQIMDAYIEELFAGKILYSNELVTVPQYLRRRYSVKK